eukprot:6776184-Karenia_brevis.AAC.1
MKFDVDDDQDDVDNHDAGDDDEEDEHAGGDDHHDFHRLHCMYSSRSTEIQWSEDGPPHNKRFIASLSFHCPKAGRL